MPSNLIDNVIDDYVKQKPTGSLVDDVIDQYVTEKKVPEAPGADYYKKLGVEDISLPNLSAPKVRGLAGPPEPTMTAMQGKAGALATPGGGYLNEAIRPIVDFSKEGAEEATAGAKQVFKPGATFKERVEGGNRVFTGAAQAASPLLIPAAVAGTLAAPGVMIPALAGGILTQQGVQKGLEHAGVDPVYSEAAGNVASFFPGAATMAMMVGKDAAKAGGKAVFGKFARKAAAEEPVAVAAEASRRVPGVKVVGQNVEQPVRSATFEPGEPNTPRGIPSRPEESAFAAPPAQKSAEESAKVFKAAGRGIGPNERPNNRRARREQVEEPVFGKSEKAQRLEGAQEDLAQEVAQKPYSQLTEEEQRAVEQLAAEGAGQAQTAPQPPLANARDRRRVFGADLSNPEAGVLKVPTAAEVKQGISDAQQAVRDKATKFYKNWTDEFTVLHDLDKVAEQPLRVEQSVGKRAQMASSRGRGNAEADLLDLNRLVAPAQKSGLLDDAVKYSTMERHQELGARIPGYQVEGGIPLAQVAADRAAMEKALGPKRMKQINEFNGKLRDYSDRLLQEVRDSGLISDKAYAHIKSQNQKYIPFHRIKYLNEELGRLPKGSKGFDVASGIIKPVEGSTEAIADPIESLVRDTYRIRFKAEQNRVAQTLADLADRSEYNGIVDHVQPNAKPSVGDWDIVHYMRNGDKHAIEVPNGVGEAMKRMTQHDADVITQAFQKWTNMLRTGITLAPEFMERNLFRDYNTAVAAAKIKGVGFTPLDWVHGFLSGVTRDIPADSALAKGAKKLWPKALGANPVGEEQYVKFLRAGGAFSGPYSDQALGKTAADMKLGAIGKLKRRFTSPGEIVRTPVDVLRHTGETAELAPRLGTFSAVERQGGTPMEAAWAARNATADFQRSGLKMRIASHAVPFLNAREQGSINFYKAFAENPLRTSLRVATQFGLPYLHNYYNNVVNFPKVWDSIPEYDKDQTIHIIKSDKKDENGRYVDIVRLPVGDMGPIFGPLRAGIEYWRGKNPNGFKGAALDALSSASWIPFARSGEFSMGAIESSVLPPPLKAMEEFRTGKDSFTGRDIEDPRLVHAKASPQQRYTSETAWPMVSLSKALGKASINVSPQALEHSAGTVGGYLGRHAVQAMPSVAEPYKFRFGNVGTNMKKSLFGAPSNAEDIKRYEAGSQLDVKKGDVEAIVLRAVDPLIKQLATTPPQQQEQLLLNAWQQIEKQIPPEEVDAAGKRFLADITNAVKKKTSALTPAEQTMSRWPNAKRASVIYDELSKADPATQLAIAQNYEDKGILTDAVMAEIANIAQRKGIKK